jgi:hypothetical protein
MAVSTRLPLSPVTLCPVSFDRGLAFELDAELVNDRERRW